MTHLRSLPRVGERRRFPPGPPCRRAIVSAVVTELPAALEPVARDPFIDGPEAVIRLVPAAAADSRRRPATRAR